MHVEYEKPPEEVTTGTLWIDRLVCLDLSFELVVAFTQGQRNRELLVQYSSKGTHVEEAGSAVDIVPFNPSTSNKCRPEEPPVDVCRDLALKIDFSRAGSIPAFIVLTAVSSGNDRPVAFLWEVQDAVPFLADGVSAQFRFDPVEPPEKLVRLTAFTARGCTVTVERRIDIRDN